jgi:hypothetical protein
MNPGCQVRLLADKLDLMNRGQSYNRHIGQNAIQEALKEERLCASTEF